MYTIVDTLWPGDEVAEIKVEEHNPPNLWPWLAALAGILLLAWFVFGRSNHPATITAPPPTTSDTAAAVFPLPSPALPPAVAPPAVEEFARNCGREITGSGEIGMQHPYATACVRRMTAALEAILPRDALERAAYGGQLEDYRSKAREIERSDDQAPEHASLVREVFRSGVELLSQMQQTRYASAADLDAQIARVREAAEAVRIDTPVPQQQPETSRFFRRVGDVLRRMATERAAPVVQPAEVADAPTL